MSIKHLLTALLILLVIGCAKETAQVEVQTGIGWMTDIEEAVQLARTENRPVMIDFMANWCPPCKKMEATTFKQETVIDKAGEFIAVRIDVDQQPDVANHYESNAGKYGGIGIPNILFLSPDQKKIAHPIGYLSPERMVAIMDSVLTLFKMDH